MCRAAATARQGVTPGPPLPASQGSGRLVPVTKAAVLDHRGGQLRRGSGRPVRRDPPVPLAGLRWSPVDLGTSQDQTSPATRWPVALAAPGPGPLPGLRGNRPMSCSPPGASRGALQHRGRRAARLAAAQGAGYARAAAAAGAPQPPCGTGAAPSVAPQPPSPPKQPSSPERQAKLTLLAATRTLAVLLAHQRRQRPGRRGPRIPPDPDPTLAAALVGDRHRLPRNRRRTPPPPTAPRIATGRPRARRVTSRPDTRGFVLIVSLRQSASSVPVTLTTKLPP